MSSTVLLGDVAEVNWGDTSITKASYREEGYRAYSASGPDGFLDHADYHGKGIVLSAIGAEAGKTWLADGDWSAIKNTIVIRSIEPSVSIDYIYWATVNPDFWPKRGSSQPFISQGDARKLKLQIPSVEEQQRVVEVLSSLQEKIELNRRMNATLEAIGQALFKHWFVDNPEKETWSSGRLSDLGVIVTGKTPPKSRDELFGKAMPFLKIPDMHGKVLVINTEDGLSDSGVRFQPGKTVPRHSTCVSCIATVGLVSLAARDLQTNQQINAIIPRSKSYRFFNFFFLKSMSEDLKILASGGSATPNLNKDQFGKIRLQIPPDNLLNSFDEEIDPLIHQIENGERQSNLLVEIRDSLLPRLMSGKLGA